MKQPTPRRPLSSLVSHRCAPLALALAAACGDPADPSGTEELGSVTTALGTTYQVGPGRTYATLQDVAGRLNPGDVVEVYGKDTAYPGGVIFSRPGTASARITIRGVPQNGRRPILSGGTNTVEFRANSYVFEGFEATGGTSRVLYHHANDITIRNTLVRDCPAHGILGADADSGSLTLEYSEVTRCGSGDRLHPVYIATDEVAYPGSVFRMQYCYLHDQRGGNNVKSRAERNEIYYNWIEGGFYRELELIGPDGGVASRREDSDVVGNVLVKTQGSNIARIGGDGTGDTSGRYRFVNNTIILKSDSPAAIQAYDRLESLELHNNVFYRQGGGGVTVLNDSSASWTSGALITGSNNWLPTGSSAPSQLSAGRGGADPGFLGVSSYNLVPASGSALKNAARSPVPSFSTAPFPSPLALLAMLPPRRAALAPGAAQARPTDGSLDIGAFEGDTGSPTTSPPPPATCVTGGAWPSLALGARTGAFTVEADVTPTAAPPATTIDGALALAQGAQTTWTGLASIVLFNLGGQIVARNGASYTAATALSYQTGATYHVRMVADLSRHTYSVYVTPPGQPEVTLASGYAFRSEQATVSSLDQAVLAGTGALKVCNLAVK